MPAPLFPNSVPDGAAALYLDLMKRSLTNWIYADAEARLAKADPFATGERAEGRDWPAMALTMIGLHRLNNLQDCAETVIRDNVPGDLLEAGVWRGGASLLMRGVLQAHGVKDRRVWLADSFAGLPPPNAAKYPHDAGIDLYKSPELAVSLEQVQENFRRYGLLDGQVKFLKGWFRDTLPTAPVERLAVLRLDGDLYESTMDTLTHLYPKLSPGGFLIVDDYGAVEACRLAVHDYRKAHGIADPIRQVDWTGHYWRRSE